MLFGKSALTSSPNPLVNALCTVATMKRRRDVRIISSTWALHVGNSLIDFKITSRKMYPKFTTICHHYDPSPPVRIIDGVEINLFFRSIFYHSFIADLCLVVGVILPIALERLRDLNNRHLAYQC